MTDPLAVKRTSPLKMMTPLIAFLVIAALWTAYWFHARGQAQERLASFERDTLALNCSKREWGGYPFRIHVDCVDPRVDAGGTTASAAKLRLIIQAWNPKHVIGAIFGPVTLNGIKIKGDTIRFSHRTEDGKLALASLLAENQTVTLSDGQGIGITRTDAHLRPASAGYDLIATATGLSLEQLRLDSFQVEGTIQPDGNFNLLSKPSEYLDAIWFVQRIANLGDTEMNAAQQLIYPLLKENDEKLPILRKDGDWYWGPFQISK